MSLFDKIHCSASATAINILGAEMEVPYLYRIHLPIEFLTGPGPQDE